MLNATVVGRIDITPDLMILHVKPDAGVPSFLPGQYVAIGLPGSAPRYPGAEPEPEPAAPDKLIKRAYSIGSSPDVRDYLEFYVAVVPTGALTSRLAMVKPGDRVFAQPKVTGTFTSHGVPPHHNLILVSTGTGIAPFMSMIRTQNMWYPDRAIKVIHGVRFPQDLAYADELKKIAATAPAFEYLPIASRATSDWTGRHGRVQKLFEEGIISLNPERDHVFLCGNPGMIDDIERDLTAKGYEVHSKKAPEGKLHLEKYW